jgi:hypothetical protein
MLKRMASRRRRRAAECGGRAGVEETTMAVLRVLNANGDDRVDFDPEVADERLARARALFEAKVGKGWMAYAPDRSGGGTQVRRFDPRRHEEIVLQPAIAGG